MATGPDPERRFKRGRLRVFFGMARGAGKTSAMLAAARLEAAAGRRVAVAYLETYGRDDLNSLAKDLTLIPTVRTLSRHRVLSEMDLDVLLARRPQLVVVDELACSNGVFSRHPKRYQDVLELLDAGLDVFTTLNVGNIESCAEAARQITGVATSDTVPDTVLEGAEVVLVDLPVEELRARLAADEIYVREAAIAAQQQIFRPGSLSALRELALRFVAEHVGREVLVRRQAGGARPPWKSGQRLLVAVSSSPTAGGLVRWTRRAAGEMHANWVAVHVEVGHPLSEAEQASLTSSLTLARELGAQVISTSDSDVVNGLLRVAHEQNVTQIIMGKPERTRVLDWLRGGSLLTRLVHESGDIDVRAVRAERSAETQPELGWGRLDASLARDCGVALGMVAGITALNAVLKGWIGYQPMGLIYLLGVAVVAMFVRRGPAMAAATLSALALDYFFVPPLFSFRIDNPSDVAVFCTYVTVALIVGNLTARLRERERAERRRERHATGLFFLTHALAQAAHMADLLGIITEEVGKAAHADVAIFLANPLPSEAPDCYSGSTWNPPETEASLALWCFRQRQPAGQGTGTQPSAEGLHLPLLAGDRCLGVLSLRFRDVAQLTPGQRDLLDAFVRQVALALDRQRLRDAEQQAELVAESERLSKTLLDSISHEMRTPLAAITSAASTLSDAPEGVPLTWRRGMTDEIQEAAGRLNRLVGNLLNMTRVETGHVRPKLDWCDVADLVQVTLDGLESELARHPVTVEMAPGLPLVRMDFVLMQQVLTNLLLNVAVHTPPGTTVTLAVASDGRDLVLSVADTGPGLSPEALAQIFDKFYRAPTAPAGGTGLGLAIVKGFVEAHSGTVKAENRPEGGTIFTIRLPMSRQKSAPGSNRQLAEAVAQ